MSAEYTAYILELLEPVGRVKAAPFFGGIGLSRDGVQFAFVFASTLYFVVDDATRARYEAAGAKPFAYDTKRRRVQVRRYFEVPEDVLAEPEALAAWARESVAVATRTRKPRPRR